MTEEFGWGQRIPKAAGSLVYNAFLWILVPLIAYRALAGFLPSTPLALGLPFIYAFGISITALQVLGALTTGMAVSVPLMSGSYVAEAYYIWSAVDGGVISVSTAGLIVGLAFQPLIFLLMLPSLFSAVKAPLTFLLEQSEAGAASPDTV